MRFTIETDQTRVSRGWLHSFWAYMLDSTHIKEITLYNSWPLIPVSTHSLHALERNSSIITGILPIANVLEKLECYVIDVEYVGLFNNNLSDYLHTANAAGVLSAMAAKGVKTQKLFSKLTPEDRDSLYKYFCKYPNFLMD